MAVGREWAHAELIGQGEGLALERSKDITGDGFRPQQNAIL
jgi:hypothetical protein